MLENSDYKKTNASLMDRIHQLEQQLQNFNKENDDLKYDNTLLYEKNVEKD